MNLIITINLLFHWQDQSRYIFTISKNLYYILPIHQRHHQATTTIRLSNCGESSHCELGIMVRLLAGIIASSYLLVAFQKIPTPLDAFQFVVPSTYCKTRQQQQYQNFGFRLYMSSTEPVLGTSDDDDDHDYGGPYWKKE
jgi:hypothetical protein